MAGVWKESVNYKIEPNLAGNYRILLCKGFENVSVKNGDEYFTEMNGIDGRAILFRFIYQVACP